MTTIDIDAIKPFRQRLPNAPQARAAHFAFTDLGDCVRLDILGDIDPYFGISAANIAAQLDRITAPHIRLRVNSAGGDVLEGVAIHNLLAAHPSRKTAEIFGSACSAASWIVMIAEQIDIWDGAMMMIHKCWQHIIGNEDDLAEAILVLRRIDDAMAAAYVRRTGLDETRIREMMKITSWMTAEEAVQMKFADRVLTSEAMSAAAARSGMPAARSTVERPLRVTAEVLAGLNGLADAMAQRGA